MFPIVSNFDTGVPDGSNNTAHTATLAVHSAGDYLLEIYGVSGAPTITWPAGWTQLFKVSNGSSNTLEARWRLSDGSEGTSINLTTSSSERGTGWNYVFNRLDVGAGLFATGTATGSSVNPDSPNLSPPWGIGDVLWLSFFVAGTNGNNTNESSAPSSYAYLGGLGLTSPLFAGASRQLRASSENPGIWTIDNSRPWVAATIAVKGADQGFGRRPWRGGP